MASTQAWMQAPLYKQWKNVALPSPSHGFVVVAGRSGGLVPCLARLQETRSPRSIFIAGRSRFCESSETGGGTQAAIAFVALAGAMLVATDHLLAAEDGVYEKYFGTAASASSYGGYGGNSSKKDSAEYMFDVPQGWKERSISKVEKGTNGTDSEFYNPKRREEKVYVTFLQGFRKLAPRENVLNNLALSDVNLQDMLSKADDIKSLDRINSKGQLYYEYEIDSAIVHSLISVTCAKNKLYAHFVQAPNQAWSRDEALLRHIHDSFTTVEVAPPLSSS